MRAIRRAICLLLAGVAAAMAAAGQEPAGSYKGDWSGASGASGTLQVELQKASEEWKCAVVFTMAGEEYKTKMKAVKVEGSKLEAQYEFEMGGTRLQSTLTGELKEKTFEGKYRTVTVAEGSVVDEGVWKATAE